MPQTHTMNIQMVLKMLPNVFKLKCERFSEVTFGFYGSFLRGQFTLMLII